MPKYILRFFDEEGVLLSTFDFPTRAELETFRDNVLKVMPGSDELLTTISKIGDKPEVDKGPWVDTNTLSQIVARQLGCTPLHRDMVRVCWLASNGYSNRARDENGLLRFKQHLVGAYQTVGKEANPDAFKSDHQRWDALDD